MMQQHACTYTYMESCSAQPVTGTFMYGISFVKIHPKDPLPIWWHFSKVFTCHKLSLKCKLLKLGVSYERSVIVSGVCLNMTDSIQAPQQSHKGQKRSSDIKSGHHMHFTKMNTTFHYTIPVKYFIGEISKRITSWPFDPLMLTRLMLQYFNVVPIYFILKLFHSFENRHWVYSNWKCTLVIPNDLHH